MTDDGLVYRHDVTAGPGGNRNVSDSIGFARLVAPSNADVPGNDSSSSVTVQPFSVFRSSIDSSGDTDVFRLKGDGSSHDISISFEGTDSNAGTLANPKVTVYRNNTRDDDAIVASDDNSGLARNAFLTLEQGAFQDLFIEDEAIGGSTGSYRVRIDDDDLTPAATAADFLP